MYVCIRSTDPYPLLSRLGHHEEYSCPATRCLVTLGQIRFSAPEGYHDDCVIALALANNRRREYVQTGDMMLLSIAHHARHLEFVPLHISS